MKQAGTSGGLHDSLLPRYSDLLSKQIDKREALLERGQTKMDKITGYSEYCTVNQMVEDFSTCKEKFVRVKEGCKQFLPSPEPGLERNSDIPTSLLMKDRVFVRKFASMKHRCMTWFNSIHYPYLAQFYTYFFIIH